MFGGGFGAMTSVKRAVVSYSSVDPGAQFQVDMLADDRGNVELAARILIQIAYFTHALSCPPFIDVTTGDSG